MNAPYRPAPPDAVSLALPSDQDATGRTLGGEELALVAESLASGTLTVTKGRFGKRFEAGLAGLFGVPNVTACSSGSAAIHAALAALDLEPGDEVITTAITDMGAVTPILYQGCVPVFADVDRDRGSVTAESVAARITPRTRAVIVTHLFGSPADLTGIHAVAAEYKLPVIEDCAQAYLATHAGHPVGTTSAFGCFSLQQGKHITAGEGGFVLTPDAAHARLVYQYVNKAWGYGDPNPDHTFLALNYRFSELQAACCVAQLAKLPDIVSSRRRVGAKLTQLLEGAPGLVVPKPLAGSTQVYWKFPILVDLAVIPGGPQALAAELQLSKIATAPRYIQKPAFDCAVIRNQKTFGASRWPWTLAQPSAVDYSPARFAGTYSYLERVLVVPVNERYTDEHVAHLAAAIRAAAVKLSGGAR